MVTVGHEPSNIVDTKKGTLITRLAHRLEYHQRAKMFKGIMIVKERKCLRA